MSRYEWEKGEFVLPSAEWAGFKAAIRDAVNSANAEKYEIALKVHEELVRELKGKRGADPWETAWDIASRQCARVRRSFGIGEDAVFEIASAVVHRGWRGSKPVVKVRKPQKKDFPRYGNNAVLIQGMECSVSFDNKARKAVWEVYESNHACDRARATVLGVAFFRALDRVKWTRGTGGSIWGNDEYNREAGRDAEGFGGSYSKGTWGPKESQGKASPAYSGYSGYGFGSGRW